MKQTAKLLGCCALGALLLIGCSNDDEGGAKQAKEGKSGASGARNSGQTTNAGRSGLLAGGQTTAGRGSHPASARAGDAGLNALAGGSGNFGGAPTSGLNPAGAGKGGPIAPGAGGTRGNNGEEGGSAAGRSGALTAAGAVGHAGRPAWGGMNSAALVGGKAAGGAAFGGTPSVPQGGASAGAAVGRAGAGNAAVTKAGAGSGGMAGSPGSSALPTGPLTLHGAGPQGADNGTIHPCTGPQAASKQQVLCVVAGAGSPQDGSAAAPFATISAAVGAARSGDIIQVAGGEAEATKLEYRESVDIGGDSDGTCPEDGSEKNLTFLGGFTRNFSGRDAQKHQAWVIGNSDLPSFLLCVQNGTTVIDGFFITTENTNRGLVGSVGGSGTETGELIISHNVVFQNRAQDIDDRTYGGGILLNVQAYASGEVSDNYSHDNETGRGSGISTFSSQDDNRWGTVKILRNRVENNLSRASHGGGMNISGAAEIGYNVVLNNRVLGTDWGGFGAGFIAEAQSSFAPVSAHHNVVMGNQGAGYGGSGENYDEDIVATVQYEFVAGNGCVNQARTSEIMVDEGDSLHSTVAFTNITVINHVCPVMSVGAMVLQGNSEVTIDHSVLWNNIGKGDQPFDIGIDGSQATYTVTNTVSGQAITGTGNVSSDPGLVDPANGNYHSRSFPDRGAFAPGGLNPEP